MLVCKHVRYSGRVQGVGFRQTVWSLAEGYAVDGFVRNLAQGDVELMAQGEENVVRDFLDEIGRRMARYVRQCVETDEAIGTYDGFDIRY